MKTCSECGNEVKNEVKFCTKCGNAFTLDDSSVRSQNNVEGNEQNQVQFNSKQNVDDFIDSAKNYGDFFINTLKNPEYALVEKQAIFGIINMIINIFINVIIYFNANLSGYLIIMILGLAILYVVQRFVLAGVDSFIQMISHYGGLLSFQNVCSVILLIISIITGDQLPYNINTLGLIVAVLMLGNAVVIGIEYLLYALNSGTKRQNIDHYYILLISLILNGVITSMVYSLIA